MLDLVSRKHTNKTWESWKIQLCIDMFNGFLFETLQISQVLMVVGALLQYQQFPLEAYARRFSLKSLGTAIKDAYVAMKP